MKARVLVLDDERNYLLILRELLGRDGIAVDTVSEPLEALKLAARRTYDAALVDLKLGEMDGLEVLRRLQRLDPELGVIIVTAYASVGTAVEALKSGAADYVLKPFDNDVLLRTLHRVANLTQLSRDNARLREAARAGGDGHDLIGTSPGMRGVKQLIERVAPTDTTVLITGETGTGKEVVARAIHDAGSRAEQPLVPVHCAALSPTLLESELFGHEKGAFTGASAAKRGRFELARGGTLFLDEVGEISEAVQVKLLRAIENRSFERVGGEETLESDARFLSATNHDLEADVRSGRFREDLYYRLNVVRIQLPPLRERTEDIGLLAQHFLARYAARLRREVRLTERSLELLMAYAWPGNVRELQNVIERALVISTGDEITPAALPVEIQRGGAEAAPLRDLAGRPLHEALEHVERDLILRALEESDYVQARAAARLGLSRSALHYKLTKHGVRGTSR